MDLSLFTSPDRLRFGCGALDALGTEAARLGRRPLLVTGRRAMAEAGITDRCLAVLAEGGLAAALYDEVEPEPHVATVDRCRAAIASHGADLVIGLGGGSAMDVAKVAAGLARETEPTAAFHGDATPAGTGLPVAAVPTTSGTGSEMTNNGVVSDPATGLKASIRHPSFVPKLALVDPALTVPCPPRVTATSGIDALVQAIESYLSVNATPLTEAVSLRGVVELEAALPDVVERGEDLALRTRAAWGSVLAGLALTNARLGVVHGLAHPIGIRTGAPHGLVCGVLLAPALDYNRDAAPEKVAALEAVLGADPAAYARDLLAACGLPATLAEYGLDPAAFEAIAEESLPSGSTKANPRPVTVADMIDLLHQVA